MKTTIIAKLKLLTTPEQFAALRQTQLAYRDALNYVSAHSFVHGKTSNSKRLQKETYAQVRAEFGLPAQMACSVPRQVGATYKGLWTKAKKNAEARRLGHTKRRFKGLDQAPHYVSPTLIYVYGHDYSLKTEQRVSLLTHAGRIIVPYQGWSRHIALLRETAEIGEAKLWYDRSQKRFSLLVSLTIQTPDPAPESHTSIVGVDVGQRYLATVASLDNGAKFYKGKEIRARADHYARLQKRLQQQGTRSATRRRIAIGQRERRLKLLICRHLATARRSDLQRGVSSGILCSVGELSRDAAGTCGVGLARGIHEKAVLRQAREVVWCRPPAFVHMSG